MCLNPFAFAVTKIPTLGNYKEKTFIELKILIAEKFKIRWLHLHSFEDCRAKKRESAGRTGVEEKGAELLPHPRFPGERSAPTTQAPPTRPAS